MIVKKQSVLHSLQVRECQEDSLVKRCAERPDTVGVVVIVAGVVRAGEGARARQRASTGHS